MSTLRLGWRDNFRVIGALTRKDVVEAVRNRTTLTTLFTVIFIILFYRFLPELESGDAADCARGGGLGATICGATHMIASATTVPSGEAESSTHPAVPTLKPKSPKSTHWPPNPRWFSVKVASPSAWWTA